MLDRLTAADFEPLAGTTFGLTTAGQAVAAELLTVTPERERPAVPGQPPRAGFALLFRAATPGGLPQGIYPLAHERFGRLDIFLVPVGRDAGGLLLEAVFN